MEWGAIKQMLAEVNTISVIVRLSLAIALGGFIGIERGRKGRPAGFRTHMLVCLGSALAMLTNQYVVQTFQLTSDPVRLGAQVISGIGFLGAGTIIVTGRNQVRGLTTAAGLWASACMGLAIGIGFYSAAIITAVAIFFISSILHRLDEHVHSNSKVMDLYLEFGEISSISKFIAEMKINGIHIAEMEITKGNAAATGGSSVAAVMTLRSKQKREHADMMALVGQVDGVLFAEHL